MCPDLVVAPRARQDGCEHGNNADDVHSDEGSSLGGFVVPDSSGSMTGLCATALNPERKKSSIYPVPELR
jgi:hypothetical protein